MVSLCTAMLAACSGEPEHDEDVGEERRTPIAAYEVVPRDLSRQVTLSATVEPRILIHLNSRTQGTVQHVHVEEGDAVEAGQLLAEFDVSEHAVELRRAEAREQEARLEYERVQQLRDSDSISVAEQQRAEAAFKVAEAERELWQTRMNFGRILATQDAVVVERHIEQGESVENQEPLFELAVMRELVLRPGVSERDVRYLTVGQRVPVRLDAMPGEFIEGTIRRIFPMADRSSRLVQVEILLPENSFEEGIRPGFLGRIPMIIDARPNTLAVPAAAIGDGDGERYIYLIRDERLHYQSVETGITRGQWTEITAGIEAEDVVLATNPIDMSEGTAVRIVNWRG
ncbi:efflux RND transporter periplasmic adaptor subunit [Aliidiomarina minuta]|uniref:Efflux RND transporter periplasmic adaptor subunit n=2 Tax=Aliidiomarina minuta TaxID=880057 RepID=A0A432W4Y2_9GAMM|nr:efflux RND transporter periplasmic adaptor subunit [Aliidiomarina minuta]